MKISSISCFGLWLQASLFLQYRLATCEQQFLGLQSQIRNATLEDADDISTVIIAAFSSLPARPYLFQFRNEFPEEHKRCLRENIARVLSKDSTHIDVIKAPADSNMTLVAVAIWTQNHVQDQLFSHLTSSKTRKACELNLNSLLKRQLHPQRLKYHTRH
jgi:hypothetical protein